MTGAYIERLAEIVPDWVTHCKYSGYSDLLGDTLKNSAYSDSLVHTLRV